LGTTLEADVAIIGAGIAGAAAAWAIAPHASVAVLEAEAGAGYHSTGRSAALLTESYEAPLVRQLTLASRQVLEDEFGGVEGLLADRGLLWVASKRQAVGFHRLRVEAEAWPSQLQLLTESEARTLCPALRKGSTLGALHEPAAKAMDVDLLLNEFLRRARALGARVVTDCRVVSISRQRGRWHLESERMTINARRVVNAAGAWADEIANLAGLAPAGLKPLRRTAFLFPAPPGDGHERWPFTIDVDESWYFETDGPNMLGSNCDEHPDTPRDVRAEDIDVAEAIEKINSMTTLDIRRVLKQWSGLRTFVSDRLPAIGPDPAEPTFSWFAALGGYGIMTSPALGRVVAEAALGLSPSPNTSAVLDAASVARLRPSARPGTL
jgi:D-arginine dehydrogenase